MKANVESLSSIKEILSPAGEDKSLYGESFPAPVVLLLPQLGLHRLTIVVYLGATSPSLVQGSLCPPTFTL